MSRITKALGAAVALLVLLVGWPIALWAAVGNPWPDGGISLSGTVTDDVVIFVLAAVLWLCWVQFVACVLVEAVAAARGVTWAVRVPIAFSFEQELARRLVGVVMTAIVGSGVAAGSATAALPATASTSATPAAEPTHVAATTHAAAQVDGGRRTALQQVGRHVDDHPTITIKRDDTLWALARDHLGDPTRWREIRDLNHGRTMVDGTVFHQADRIRPGWQFKMPADATGVESPQRNGGPPQQVPSSVRVGHGDTLSSIAARHLGSADRWPEIMRLNHGKQQANGGALADPDLLQPGWVLRMPGGTTQPPQHNGQHAGPRQDSEPPDQRTDQGPRDEGPRNQPQGENTGPGQHRQQDPGDQNRQQPTDEPTQQPTNEPTEEPSDQRDDEQNRQTEPPPAPLTESGSATEGDATEAMPETSGSAGTRPAEQPDPSLADSGAVAAAQDDDTGQAALWAAGGIGVVLATGLVGFLARRRRQQSRRRQFGERIALPTGDPAVMETELRQIDDPLTIETVDLALRHLALSAAESRTALPKVQIARLTPYAFEVYLAEVAHLPEPFEPTNDANLWRVPRESVAGLVDDAEQLRTAVPAPYPALVTLGIDDEGGQILVDLEQLGAIGVVGDRELTRQVLAAMTIELSVSQWADDLLVTVVNGFEDLEEGLGTGRIHHRDLDDALETLEARARAARVDLDEIGADSAAQARADEWDERLWTPEIIVVLGEIDPAQRRRLNAVVSELPRVAVAAVSQTSTAARWVAEVSADGEDVKAVLQPAGVRVVPQRVSDETYRQALELIDTTRQPAVQPEESPVERPEPRDVEEEEPIAEVRHLRNGFAFRDVDDPQPEEERGTPAERVAQVAEAESALGTWEREAEPGPAHPPTVLVLGPLDVADAGGPIDDDRRNKALEIAAYLALRPGLGVEAFTDALWPDRNPATQQSSARRNRVRELRKWLGTDAEGRPYVPEFRRGSPYELHEGVRTDWHLWCDLVGDDPREASSSSLDYALRLIRGRPFEGVKPGTYAWAQPLITEMLAQIEDCADEVGRRRLLEGRWLAAERAASVGLMCEPVSERLYRTQIRAAYAAGNLGHAQEAINRMLVFFAKLESDVEEDETAELLALVREGAPRERVLAASGRL